ncbi:MAG: formyltetrahydrofolate deformylase [Solirubrobacterales bacterium]|nr:formyltetrahydrofolate deformylase [Solirubrobacterales bacterium]MBV9167384.1 formyltetrahydrofolate deformylase [Solirubrobacterales bacterium]
MVGTSREDVGRLVVACPDRPAILAAVVGRLAAAGANIITFDQFSTAPEGGRLYLRAEFLLRDLPDRLDDVRSRVEEIAEDFEMQWRLEAAARRKRVAIFVSRYEHCLLDLLWRWRRGELRMDIVAVVSNHRDLEADVAAFDVPYEYIPVTPDTKAEAEQRQLDLLAGKVDLVVLARYMQILSGDFLGRIGVPVINIHHSFLPAFAGREPYARAHDRGVKLIGATAHYATEDLDEGPIIEQDVRRVSHRADPEMLTMIGRDIERTVFARAVHWHLEDRVLVHENRTIVFWPG